MASASFTLRAVDATKAAFASVQNSLTKLHSTAKIVGTGLATFFGFSAAIGGIRRLNGFLEDAEKNAQKLGLSSEELNKLTIATDAADRAAMNLQKTTALAAASVAGLFTGVDVSARAAEIRVRRVSDELKTLHKQIGLVVAETDLLSDTPATKFAAIGDVIANLNKEISDSDPSRDAIANAQRALQIAQQQKIQAEISLTTFKDLGEAIKGAAKTEKDYQFSLLSETEQQKRNNEAIKDRERSLLFLKRRLGPKFEEFDITTATPQDIALMLQMREELQEYNDLLGKRKVIETDLQIIAREAGSMIAQGFEDAILSGQKLSEVVRSLGRDLVRLVFNQMVTQRLAKGIAVGLSGGGFAGFMADGGPVSAGSSYIVGERGPELFVPRSSGSIVPNEKMTTGGGGMGGVTVNYNIAAGVSRGDLVPILEQERKRLKAEIPDMVRRGGGYRAAFA
jgi:hypothetical protein